jgi:hypothetical protein
MTRGAPQGEPQNCREFTAQVRVGGQPQQAVGQSCQQPDGSYRSRRIRPACRSRSTHYRRRRPICIRTLSHSTGGIPGSMGRRSLSAVRFSSPMVFTISITMRGSTMVAFPMGVSGTAAFTEAGGERQALRQCRPREAYAFRPRPRCAPASDRLRPRVEIAHATGRNKRPRC